MGAKKNEVGELKLKPMKCELNFLSKSDGSAILSQGETVALVSVNGPLDIKSTSQSIEKSTLEILFCSKSGKPCVADRFKENVIRQTCEAAVLGSLYPRTGITITIQELEDYGGFLSCALNCACLALLNAGVSMRHVFASATCAVDERGEIVCAPAQGERAHAELTAVFRSDDRSLFLSCALNCACLALLNAGVSMRHVFASATCAVDERGEIVSAPAQGERAHAELTAVFRSDDRSLVTCTTEGSFSEDSYREALERCRAASDLVFAFYRDQVSKYCTLI